MSCELGPVPPIPVLPAPFSIAPPALPPIPSTSIDFCCKQLNFSVPPIPLPLLPGVLLGFPTALNAMLAAVEAYLDALPLLCPKE